LQQARYIIKRQTRKRWTFQAAEATLPLQSFITFSIAVRVQRQLLEAKGITLRKVMSSKYLALQL
jgi:hypothetical protein